MKRELSDVHNSKSERFNVKCVCQLIYKEDKSTTRRKTKKTNARYQSTTTKAKKEKRIEEHRDF